MKLSLRASKYIVFLVLLFSVSACEDKIPYESKSLEIFPPHDLFTVALFRMNNLNIAPAYFANQWTLVVLDHAPCNDACEAKINFINSVQNAQRLFVFDNPASTQHIKKLTDKYKNVSITMGATANSSDFFFAQFDIEGIESEDKYDTLYFVGPNKQIQYAVPLKDLTQQDVDKELNFFRDNVHTE